MAYADPAKQKAWRLANAERIEGSRRAWRERNPEWKRASKTDSLRRWDAGLDEVTRRKMKSAHEMRRQAERAGRLVRPDTCEECGQQARIEAAHWNYSEALRVRWLCRPCHIKWDREVPKSGR